MVRHHTKLVKFYDREFIGKVDNALGDNLAERRLLDSGATWRTGRNLSVSHNGAETFATLCFFKDDMVDKRREIVMTKRPPMVGMLSRLL